MLLFASFVIPEDVAQDRVPGKDWMMDMNVEAVRNSDWWGRGPWFKPYGPHWNNQNDRTLEEKSSECQVIVDSSSSCCNSCSLKY